MLIGQSFCSEVPCEFSREFHKNSQAYPAQHYEYRDGCRKNRDEFCSILPCEVDQG